MGFGYVEAIWHNSAKSGPNMGVAAPVGGWGPRLLKSLVMVLVYWKTAILITSSQISQCAAIYPPPLNPTNDSELILVYS